MRLGRLAAAFSAGAAVIGAAACGGEPSAAERAAALYQGNCLRCHGSTGHGGIGPTLDDVEIDFPDCEVLIEWISLGSNNWPSDTYGARNKPVEGNMPGFASLDDEEVAALAAYVLDRFGDVDDTSDCTA